MYLALYTTLLSALDFCEGWAVETITPRALHARASHCIPLVSPKCGVTAVPSQEQLRDVKVYQLHTEGPCPLVDKDCQVHTIAMWLPRKLHCVCAP